MNRTELHDELLGLSDSFVSESFDLQDVLAALGKLAGQLIVGGLQPDEDVPERSEPLMTVAQVDLVDTVIAQRKYLKAGEAWRLVAALPGRIGSRVLWTNGVLWERVGPNGWKAISDDSGRGEWWPSEHVVSKPWERVDS